MYVQADRQFRSKPQDIAQFYVRSGSGAMVPLENLVTVTETAGAADHQPLQPVPLGGDQRLAAPGYSSGEAIAAMEELARKVLPAGFGYEWSGLSLEEIQSGASRCASSRLGLLVVYLTLAAQYESFVLPFIILLGRADGRPGRARRAGAARAANDVYCQIGLVMLIGLSARTRS